MLRRFDLDKMFSAKRWTKVDRLLDFQLSLTQLEERSVPATFTVTVPIDSTTGSFRGAIQLANATPGPDTIVFNIPNGGKAVTLSLGSDLPVITETLTIDATTQPGYTGGGGNPFVTINGKAGTNTNGLRINNVPNCTIKAVAITNFSLSGLAISGAGATGNSIVNSVIGATALGDVAAPNGTGVFISGGASNNLIRGNTISGNTFDGVLIQDAGSSGNKIQGNIIGLRTDGKAALGNGRAGVYLYANASGNFVGVDGDGVNDNATERNAISGNATGVYLQDNADGNRVAGNFIGTNLAGSAKLGAQTTGVWVFNATVDNTVIGTNGDGVSDGFEGNVLTGNQINVNDGGNKTVVAANLIGANNAGTVVIAGSDYGIVLTGTNARVGTKSAVVEGNLIVGATYGVSIGNPTATGNVVAGNRIGVLFDGVTAAPNATGVHVSAGATGNTVGGTAALARNVISGNTGDGVTVTGAGTSGNFIQGNYIGVGADGSTDLGNANGVVVQAGAGKNRVGGGAAGAGNVIAGNATDVFIGADENLVQGNRVSVNAAETAVIAPSFGYGIYLAVGAAKTVIGTDSDGTTDGTEGNIIGYASTAGVFLQNNGGAPDQTVIAGNRIGLASNGTTLLNAGGVRGIWLSGATNTRIGSNADGLNDINERNIIIDSANSNSILLSDGTAGTTIAGNYIGVNATGTVGLATGGVGISVQSTTTPVTNTLIGGTTAAARNVIGAATYGVLVSGAGATNVTIRGNSIGVNAAGTAAIGNLTGVLLQSGATNVTVGGTNVTAVQTATVTGAGGSFVLTFNGSSTGILPVGAPASQVQTALNALSTVGGVGGSVSVSLAGNVYTVTFGGTLRYAVLPVLAVTPLGGASGSAAVVSQGLFAGNVVSGNTSVGVQITGAGTSKNTVAGNFIGTNAAGTAALANNVGVSITGAASGNFIGTDGNGVTDSAEGNVISGNASYGILINGADGNRVAGNLVGLNAAGTAAVPNPDGVAIFGATGNVIGTDGSNDAFNASERNIISGNSDRGVILSGANVVAGNWIGLRADGAALGNQFGIQVTEVGGRVGTDANGIADADERNVISGNTLTGIIVRNVGTTGAAIAGNFIGTDPTGALARPNGIGIDVTFGAANNTVGGANVTAVQTFTIVGGGSPILLTFRGIVTTPLPANPTAAQVQAALNALSSIGGVGGSASVTKVGNFYTVTFGGALAYAVNPALGLTVGGTAGTVNIASQGLFAGNVVSGNTGAGVNVAGVGTSGNKVQGNLIGTNAAGTGKLGNLTGVYINGGSSGNTIGGTTAGARNVISSNNGTGVFLQDATTGNNTVSGNFIGVDITGAAALGNSGYGVLVDAGAFNSIIGGSTNTPGTGLGNVISGNGSQGVVFQNVGAGNKVQGNVIGLNAAGSAPLTNGSGVGGVGLGVQVIGTSDGVLIGGVSDLTAAAGGLRNVISGNKNGNVVIGGSGTPSIIRGNYIGTNLDGTAAFNIAGSGIGVIGGTGTLVGGSNANEGNLIAGAGPGVLVRFAGSDGTLVQGNRIGTDKTGTAKLGINSQGVLIDNGAKNTLVGGGAGAGNVVAGSAVNAIQIDGTGGNPTNTRVQGNFLGTDVTGLLPLGNAGSGVVMTAGADGSVIGAPVGSNDVTLGNVISNNPVGVSITASAGGANTVRLNTIIGNATNFLNALGSPAAPSVDLAATVGGGTRVRGAITGTPGATVTVDFYQTPVGVAGASRYLGTAILTLNGAGAAGYDLVVPGTLNPGTAVTATLTRSGGGTSGFSTPQSALAPLSVTVSAPRVVPEGTEVTVTSRVTAERQDAVLTFAWEVVKVGSPGLYATGTDASLVFTPDDNGTYTVTLTVTDTTNAESISYVLPGGVRATNVAPLPTILDRDTGAAVLSRSLDVGTTLRLRATATEPGPLDQPTLAYQWSVNGVPVSTAIDHDFTPATSGDSALSLRVTDKDGGTASRGVIVTARGALAPAIAGLPARGVEGATLTATVQIDGFRDTSLLIYDWLVTKDGANFFSRTSFGADQFPQISFTPDDNALYVVRLRVSDPATGATGSTSAAVPVDNVLPAVRLTRLTAAPALGAPVAFASAVREPGTSATHDDLVQYRWSVRGPAGFPAPPLGLAPGFAFTPTAPGTYIVTVTATDKDGDSSSDADAVEVTGGTRPVTIGNLPAGDQPEGARLALTASVPGAGAVTFNFAWVVTRNGDPFAVGSGAAYAFDLGRSGRFGVRVTATGSDGSVGVQTASVVAVNAPPQAVIAPTPATADEGARLTLTSLSRDPGGRDESLALLWTATGPGIPGSLTAAGRLFHLTLPNDGVYTVTLKATDPSGASTTATRTLTGLNVAPAVAILNDGTGGGVVRLKAGVTEPGPLDKLALTYQWSVNQVPVAGQTGATFVTTAAGVVSVAVSDDRATTVTNSDVRVLTAPGTYVVAPPSQPGNQILVIGTPGADTIDASALTTPVVLDGGAGDDTLVGGSGGDVLVAGTGANRLVGGDGNNLFLGGGDDTMLGGRDDDDFRVHFSNVVLDAGAGGMDTIDLSGVPFGVTLDLTLSDGVPRPVNAGNGSTLAITGDFEALIGSAKADVLTASAGATVSGGGGGDKLTARGAGATLIGGSDGGDELTAGAGGDGSTLVGSDGPTRFVVSTSRVTLIGGGAEDDATLDVGALQTLVDLGGGNDRIVADGADGSTLIGGGGSDDFDVKGNGMLIIGADGTADVSDLNLVAESGDDTFSFEGNNTTLIGGDGDDVITLKGGRGNELLTGDGVDQVFVFEGENTIVEGGGGGDFFYLEGSLGTTLLGGDGADTEVVTGGTGALVSGGGGADTLIANTADGFVTLLGGDGEDVIGINPLTGVTVPDGRGGTKFFAATAGGNILAEGGAGADLMRVFAGSNVLLLGGEGDDGAVVSGGVDVIAAGGAGADTLVASGVGDATLLGGSGEDTLIANPAGPVTIATAAGPLVVAPGSGDRVTLIGGEDNDQLSSGGGEGVLLVGNAGADALLVSGGLRATLLGGAGGDDYTVTGTASMTLVVTGDDGNTVRVNGGGLARLFGGAGVDHFLLAGGTDTSGSAGGGADILRVSGGLRTSLSGGDGDDGVFVSGGTGVQVEGNAGRNQMLVTGGTNVRLIGGEQSDVLYGRGGAGTTLVGGGGADTIYAANPAGRTVISGGDGDDRVIVSPTAAVTLLGGTADETVLAPLTLPASGLLIFGDVGDDRVLMHGGGHATVVGGAGADTLLLFNVSDVIGTGGAGRDVIAVLGGGDNSTLIGGDDADTIYLKDAPNVVVGGGDGGDTIVGIGNGGFGFGDGGDDLFELGTLVGTTLLGGTADETVIPAGGAFGLVVSGEAGDDTFRAVLGDRNLLFGGSGKDTFLNLASDNTTLYGLADDDTFDLRDGADVTALGDLSVKGFTGNDTFLISGGTRVVAFGEKGNDVVRVTGGDGVSVYGGSGADVMRVEGGADVLLAGGNDNDVLIAAASKAAQLFGGLGDDLLYSGSAAGDTLVGEEGNDRYQLTMSSVAGGVVVTLDEARKLEDAESFRDSANFGTDTIDLRTFTVAATLDLSRIAGQSALPGDEQQVAPNLRVVLFGNFETVFGTALADAFTGNDADNTFYGFGGDDTLIGGPGDDTLIGGAGSNRLVGGAGSDLYPFTSADAGVDTVVESAADAGLDSVDFSPLTLGPGRDLLAAGLTVNLGLAGPQTVSSLRTYVLSGGAGVEGAIGTRFADTLIGTAADNSLVGGAGDDSLVDGPGNDTLAGGAGDNALNGGAGDDWYQLTPGGIDRLTDPSGIDTLSFLEAARGVTVTLAPDAGQVQTIDDAGDRLALTGTFERLIGSTLDDDLTGNAADNDVIGMNGLDTLTGGGGTDTLQGDYTQLVLLDFESDTRPGEYAYGQPQRDLIAARLTALYAPFGVVFTQDAAAAAAQSARFGRGAFTTVRFNAGAPGGSSNQIDPRNASLAGFTQINAYDFLVKFLPNSYTPATLDGRVTELTVSITAHEVAHQLGLRHADAFGPIGGGIYVGGNLTPNSFVGSYAPPTVATDTPTHVLQSPLSLGTPAAGLLDAPNFGEREALKLAFGRYGSGVAEQVAPHGAVGTAQPLTLQPLFVPNTLRPGRDAHSGPAGAPSTFSAFAAAVVGSIGLDPATGLSDRDTYAFGGRRGQVYTFELSSATAKRFAGQSIDGVLKLYDSAGRLLAQSDDDFESKDSLLVDVTLPADGTYYLVVSVYNDGVAPDTRTGRYELLAYRMIVGQEAGRLDVITPTVGHTPTAPVFVLAPTAASGTEGAALTAQFAAFNPPSGGGGGVRYELAGAPAGATIDPLTGQFFWSPPDDGAYTFDVRAVNALGGVASAPVTVTVANAPPQLALAGLPAAPTEGSVIPLSVLAVDPSAVDQAAGFTYSWTVSRGATVLRTGTAPTLDFTPPNDGNYRVVVRVTDKDLGTATLDRTFAVANAPPAVTLTPSVSSAAQGMPVTFTATASDASPEDTAAGFTYTWTVNGVTMLSGHNLDTFGYTPRVTGVDLVAVTVRDNSDAVTKSFTLPVLNVAPTITGLAVTTPAAERLEGSPIEVALTFADPGRADLGGVETYTVRWQATGSGGEVLSGALPAALAGATTFSFTPNDSGLYDIRVEVVEDTPSAANDARLLTGVAVINVGPTLTVYGSGAGLLGDNLPFFLLTSDPGAGDDAAGYTFKVDWDNDGAFDEVLSGPAFTILWHAFTTPGDHDVRVVAFDHNGQDSDPAVVTVSIAPISVVGGVLTVYGTEGDDAIAVTPADSGSLLVSVNGVSYGPFSGIITVRVLAGGGNDATTIESPSNDVTFALDGGAGDDRFDLTGTWGGMRVEGGVGFDRLRNRGAGPLTFHGIELQE